MKRQRQLYLCQKTLSIEHSVGGKLDGLCIDVHPELRAVVERWWLASSIDPLSMLHRIGRPAVVHHNGSAAGHEEYWLWGKLITPEHPLWDVASGEKTE